MLQTKTGGTSDAPVITKFEKPVMGKAVVVKGMDGKVKVFKDGKGSGSERGYWDDFKEGEDDGAGAGAGAGEGGSSSTSV